MRRGFVWHFALVGLEIAQAFFEAFEFGAEFVDLGGELGHEGFEPAGVAFCEPCGFFELLDTFLQIAGGLV